MFGLAPTAPLRRRVRDQEARAEARFAAAPETGKVRCFCDVYDGAASWSRVERIIARTECGALGSETRFVVTNLQRGRPRALYEDLYCRRGRAENHIKSWKAHLRADRTSCSQANANQFRLFLHGAAYRVLWGVRTLMPRRSYWRTAQFDTLRLRLIKLSVRIVKMKTMIKLHLPTFSPDRHILRYVLGRTPCLVVKTG